MSDNIIQAEVHIKGTRPFLHHRFSPQALAGGRNERTGVAGNDPNEWKETVMALDKTHSYQLYFDSSYVFTCLREGAKYTRRNRTTLQGPVSATLQVTDTIIPFDDRYLPHGLEAPPPTDPTEPVYLDIRGVRNPTTKARNVRYRVACTSGWECTFHLSWDKTIVGRAELEAITHDAGTLVGLGSGRAIGYGRFKVMRFEVVE